MSFRYDPKDHIQDLAIAPRSESFLDQHEITIQSYQTNIPFDYEVLNQGIESAWLSPRVRFGVFSCTPLSGHDVVHIVLGLQDELTIRAYDYDARRPLWFTWQNIIIETISVHYFQDENGLLRFKATGGGRRITEDRLHDFNSAFLKIPKEAVKKRDFDLDKLRKLCFERFADRLYMLRFADPSGEEYRSIDHALFQSRQYIDPHAERLHEIQADNKVRIESFDSDIEIHGPELQASIQVRFFIRGLSGALRLRFPKISYKDEPKTMEEQARIFYRMVDITENSILDADYYTHLPRSLDELDVELGLFVDNVDLAPFRDVMLNTVAREQFFHEVDLETPWSKWQPHLRALDELLPTADITDHLTILLAGMISRDPMLAGRLLTQCQQDAKMYRIGHCVAHLLASRLQSLRAEIRAQLEETLLSWAIDKEYDSWDVDPEAGEILVYNLRWRIADLSLDVLSAILAKVVGLIHHRLIKTDGNTCELLGRFNWCMTVAEGLPPTYSKLTPALRLVAERKIPSSVAEASRILKDRVSDLNAIDDAVLEQFGLPLWPYITATRENRTIKLQNDGIGIAHNVRAAPSGILFGHPETSGGIDLCPGKSVQLATSGTTTTMDVEFTKYGTTYRIQIPITLIQRPARPTGDTFDWASQAELCRATQRVLGEEEAPNKGTISRAIQAGHIETNGLPGRQCLVKVDSYKEWIRKTKGLANDEVFQIMDAVMSEIRGRKPRNNTFEVAK